MGSGQPVNDQSEDIEGGRAGRFVGKAKAMAGAALGNDELAREGRLQEAQSDAERAAEQERAQARQAEDEADTAVRREELKREREQLHQELAAEEREAAIEHERELAQAAAERNAARKQADAGSERAAGEREALDVDREAERLVEQARQADARADAVDPEAGR